MFIFLLCMVALTPVSTFLIGKTWMKHPPRDINFWVGYRTEMSMKSQDTWDFANKYCAEIWYKWSGIIAIFSVVVMLCFKNGDYENVSIYLTVVQMIFLCTSIVPVERELRRRFDKNGRKK